MLTQGKALGSQNTRPDTTPKSPTKAKAKEQGY